MKITYTAPNRAHHYPYAEALHRSGQLHAFVSGFSRFSPRSPLPSIDKKLKRQDFFQNIYLASIRCNAPYSLRYLTSRVANAYLDDKSYKWAKDSDVFIYFRTQGLKTTRRLHRERARTLCVMEEVNSHVAYAEELMQDEFKSLGLGKSFEKYEDYDMRLRTYEEADCILCPSEFVRRSFLLKGFSEKKLIKVNFGFPAIEAPRAEKQENVTDIFRVLYVGQINYRKGLRYAIEAFRRLKHPKKEFVIVGPTTSITGLERTVIPKEVVFTGVLKGEDLNEQYRRASVFILPSIEEGLALVQGEALSFGIPLLITTNTGGEDLITNGVEGHIVPPRDINSLAEKLQQMADDKVCLKLMGFAALQAAYKLGNWDNTVGRLTNELKTILNHRGQSALIMK